MHHSRILKRAFSFAHHRAAVERKDLPGSRRCIRRGLRDRNAASTKNRKALTKGRSNIGVRCPPPKADWNLAKPSVQISSLISAALGGSTAMLVQGSASISDKLLPQSKIAQQIGNSMSQLSRRTDWIAPATRRLSGQ